MNAADGVIGAPEGGASGACLDAETLAAAIDGVLSAGERERVEAHLSTCASCRELFAETLHLLEDLPAEAGATPVDAARTTAPVAPTPPVAPTTAVDTPAAPIGAPPVPIDIATRRRPRWVMPTLAAAAVVTLAVALPWRTWMSGEARQAEALHAELTRAVGNARYTEPRLSGFEYGTLRGPLRSATGVAPLPPQVTLVTAQIEQFAASHSSAATQRIAGVARLVSSEYDEAIAALDRAATASPQSATTINDLAAAYIARGTARANAADLERGLAEARRAAAIDPEMPAAAFNEALALSRLALNGDATKLRDARVAWSRYLRLDPKSPWSAEAHRMLDDLGSLPPSPQ